MRTHPEAGADNLSGSAAKGLGSMEVMLGPSRPQGRAPLDPVLRTHLLCWLLPSHPHLLISSALRQRGEGGQVS